jgi:hypothetical protein
MKPLATNLAGLKIQELKAIDEDRFTTWLQQDPKASIYHLPIFLKCVQSITGGKLTYLVASIDDKFVGALPWLKSEQDSLGGIINSMPWYGSHGGCIARGSNSNEVRKALLQHYQNAVACEGVLSATMILTHDENEFAASYQSELKPDAEDHRIGQVTELPLDGDELTERITFTVKQKTRNLIRKSLKQGFTESIEDTDYAWKFLYETHLENMQAMNGKNKPKSHFEALRRNIPTNMRRLSIAYLDKKPVAALLLLMSNQTIEYITPVVKVDYRSLQPLSFLIFKAMLELIKKDFHYWNWGGSWENQSSLRHFKAGWGAVEKPYQYMINVTPLGKTTFSTHTNNIFDLFPNYYIYPHTMEFK